MVTTVVNRHHSPHDVYIGRGSMWGNPFRMAQESDRATVVTQYREYFWDRYRQGIFTRSDILALKDKTLGCYCKPLACHGDVIVEAIERLSTPPCLFIGGLKGPVPAKLFFDVTHNVLDRMDDNPRIIYNGGWSAIERMVKWVANDRQLPITGIEARWDSEGSDAAYNRDRHVFSTVTHAIIFWDGWSRDVPFMLAMAKRYSVKVKLVIFEVATDV